MPLLAQAITPTTQPKRQIPKNFEEFDATMDELQTGGVSSADRDAFAKQWKADMQARGFDTNKMYSDWMREKTKPQKQTISQVGTDEKGMFGKWGGGIKESWKAGQEQMAEGAEMIASDEPYVPGKEKIDTDVLGERSLEILRAQPDYAEKYYEVGAHTKPEYEPYAAQKALRDVPGIAKDEGRLKQNVVGALKAAGGAAEVIASPLLGFFGAAAKDIDGEAGKIMKKDQYEWYLEKGATPDQAAAATDADYQNLAQSASKITAPVMEFMEENPLLAESLKVGMWFAGAKPAAEIAKKSVVPAEKALFKVGVGTGEVAGATATRLEAKAVAQETILKRKAAEKLITPKLTPKKEAEAILKAAKEERITITGKTKKAEIELSARKKAVSEEVAEIKDIEKKGTQKEKLVDITKAQKREAEALGAELAKRPVSLKEGDVSAVVKAVETDIARGGISADATKYANDYIREFKRIISKKEITTADDLWKARIELDSWATSRSKNIFGEQATAKQEALFIVRKHLNEYLEQSVSGVSAKQSFRKWSLLQEGAETVAVKAGAEANTIWGRIFAKYNDTLRFKEIAALGFVGVPSVIFAPAVVGGVAGIGGAGYLVYKAGKWVLSPTFKRALAEVLRFTEKALPKAPKEAIPALKEIKKDALMLLKGED